MREIKFRAVILEHNINKVFWLEDLIKPLFSTREFIIPWLLEGNEPDRFTGLKDKNGKEIYEGDIVRDYYDKVLQVSWADCWGRYMLSYDGEFCQYYLNDFHKNNTDRMAKTMEIIGNIHENPELLGKK